MESNLIKHNYKKYLLSLILIISTQLVQAGGFDTTLWRANPTFIVLEKKGLEKEDAVIIEDNRLLENKFSKVHITRHRIIQVNSQSGLDDNNKIAVYVDSDGSIEEIHARSISPDGKVVEITEQNIKEIGNYGSGQVHLFAIEGASVGCQIEYSYTLIYPYTVGIERFSKDERTLHASLIVDCNSFYTGVNNWKLKTYNGSFQKTKGDGFILFEAQDLMPLQDELYSTPKANQALIEYHFSKESILKNVSAEELYRRYYFFMYQELIFRPVHLGHATSEISRYDIEVEGDIEKTLSKMDAHIKKNYFYTESGGNRDDIGTVFMTKKANSDGFLKLYSVFLKQLKIDYQILCTCSKYDRYFDTTAFSFYTMEDYLYYFPAVNKYIDPLEKTAQFGVIPYKYIGNNAFVIYDSAEKKHGYRTTMKFHHIKSEAFDQNTLEFDIDIEVLVDNRESIYHIAAAGEGQYAYSYNDDIYYTETIQEEQEAMIDIIDWRYPDEEVLSCKMTEPEKWGDISTCEDYKCKRSFIAEVRSASFFETVGDKLILRVGSLIGPQDEFRTKHYP